MKLIPQRVCILVSNEGDELDSFLQFLSFSFTFLSLKVSAT